MMPAVQFQLTTNTTLQNFSNICSKDDMTFHYLKFQGIAPEITIHLYFLWSYFYLLTCLPICSWSCNLSTYLYFSCSRQRSACNTEVHSQNEPEKLTILIFNICLLFIVLPK